MPKVPSLPSAAVEVIQTSKGHFALRQALKLFFSLFLQHRRGNSSLAD